MLDPQAELLTRNLLQVFNERDEAVRLQRINELYTHDALFHEADETFRDHPSIHGRVTELLKSLPPQFTFRAVGPASRNHDAVRLTWTLGPEGGPVVATGQDVGLLRNGKIAVLYVFIDPPAA